MDAQPLVRTCVPVGPARPELGERPEARGHGELPGDGTRSRQVEVVLHSYERAAELFATGVLDPSVFITDRLPLDQDAEAIETFRAGGGLKTQVLP
jgi:hypothetical protein